MSEQHHHEIAERDRDLNLKETLCSLCLPGLGQIYQERYVAAFDNIFFLAIAILYFYYSGLYGLIVYVPLLLFSALDAAFWPGKKRDYNTLWIRRVSFVVLCLACIIGGLLPAFYTAREAARRMTCSSMLKQITLAFHNYHDAHHSFPPAYTVDANCKPLHSWRVLILPYLEKNDLYSKIRLYEPWDSEYNSQFHDQNEPVFPLFNLRGIETAP